MGDQTCVLCHVQVAETYYHHPMGRSFFTAANTPALERYDAGGHNPFERNGLKFLVERTSDRDIHKVSRLDAHGHVLVEMDIPIQYALGSGTRGRSYVTNRDGYLFQSPISWFSQKKIWDMSPGFENSYPPDRMVVPGCLFCHANYADAVENTANRYREPIFRGYGIGCERCHGPGALHVESRQRGDVVSGDVDYTIVDPRHLEPRLRDNVCEQCHLQGQRRNECWGKGLFDYRPGLPLHDFWAVFIGAVEAADKHKAVGQVEQMYSSRCFQESKGALGCISCHDPHVLPAQTQRVDYYRSRCLACHEIEKTGDVATIQTGSPVAGDISRPSFTTHHLPLTTHHSADDNCIDCHMPRLQTSDIAHTAASDHRILRSPLTAIGPARLQPGQVPIVNFYQDLLDTDDVTVQRDLGVALAGMHPPQGLSQGQIAHMALPLLERAVQNIPQDAVAWESLGWARLFEGNDLGALEAVTQALQLAPERETSLFWASELAQRMDRPEAAVDYLRRLVKANPWMWQNRQNLANLLAKRHDWPAALAECRAALPLNPLDQRTRLLLITSELGVGNKETARREFETLLALHPQDERLLRSWWEGQTGRE